MNITLQAVNELIQSLESGELSIKERKYRDVMRWAIRVAGERDAALNAERVWEKTMMEACGEDGPASVASEIRNLRALRDTALTELRAQVEQLAAENAGLNNFIAKSCYVQAGENASWYPAIDHAPEIPTTNKLSIEESQFLTDVITAAGLLSCGKQDKGLARRMTDFCVAKRGSANPAQLREGAK